MKRKKKQTTAHPEIDWNKMEDIFLRSFRGNRLTDEELTLIVIAHKAYPREYSKRQLKVRTKEIAAIRGVGRG